MTATPQHHGKGVDYSFARPKLSALKAEGHTFVCRYLSHHTGTAVSGKDLTKTELAALRAADLDVVTVWEVDALDPLRGRSEGARDARDAAAELNGLGMSDAVVYFACDFDVQPTQLSVVLNYLKGAASAIGYERTGVYGGRRIVKEALDAGVVKFAWQTAAWSNGTWDPRAQLRQTHNGVSLGGGTVDIDASIHPDFGQWPRPSSSPNGSAHPAPSKPAAKTSSVTIPVVRVANVVRGQHSGDIRLVRKALNAQLHLKPGQLPDNDVFDGPMQQFYDYFRSHVLNYSSTDATGTVGIKSLTELGKRSRLFKAVP